MAWTLTRHLMAPQQVVDQGMGYDSVNGKLVVNCEQNSESDPFFLYVDPDDFTTSSIDSSAVSHVWSVYEYLVSAVDSSIYMTATKGGGGQFLVRYSIAGTFQWELSAYYSNFRENPADNTIWASVLSGGLYSNNIRNFSRVNGATVTTHNVGRSAQFPIFDAAGNYYFTSGTVGEDKKLYTVNLSTGAVTTLLTHASTLTEMVYNSASNALWICTNNPTWIEYSIGGAALTGNSVTMPGGFAIVFGTAALDPNDHDSLFGTRWFTGGGHPRIFAVSLADGSTVANFTEADGLDSCGHGTFAGSRLCFYALDRNADTGYFDIMEACPPDEEEPAAMPDAEYNWPNPRGPRGILAALRFVSYGLFPPVTTPPTLVPLPSGVSHTVINWQELVASTHPSNKEIAYEFAPDRDRHSSHDFDDTGVYSGIYRPEDP